MKLTKRYRIWWNKSKQIMTDHETRYNEGNITYVDEEFAGITGFYESDARADIQHEIIEKELLIMQ